MGQSIIEESSVYQGAIAKGLAVGKQEGRQEAVQQGMQQFVLKLLTRKLGELSEPAKAQIKARAPEQLQALGYDFLSFSSMAELTSWLEANKPAEA